MQAQINEVCEKLLSIQSNQQQDQATRLAASLEHTHLQLTVDNLKQELAAIRAEASATQDSRLAMQGMLEESKKRDAEVRREVREAEERVGKVRGEVAAVMDRVVKETEGKFRRVLTLDAQVGSLKQEHELLRLRRMKDDQVMQEERAKLERRLVKAERSLEESREKLQVVYRGFNREVGGIRDTIDQMRGPLVCETRNAQKENEALLREIGRTQNINREIIGGKSAQISPSKSLMQPNSPMAEAERAFKDYISSSQLSTQVLSLKVKPPQLKMESTGMSLNDLQQPAKPKKQAKRRIYTSQGRRNPKIKLNPNFS